MTTKPRVLQSPSAGPDDISLRAGWNMTCVFFLSDFIARVRWTNSFVREKIRLLTNLYTCPHKKKYIGLEVLGPTGLRILAFGLLDFSATLAGINDVSSRLV